MSIANNQLEEIFEETQQRFSGNPSIQVTPLEGTPPEKYEICYNIKGMHKSDSDELIGQDSHTITISIPFGFPHFPPSCIPSSPIFHPDFDPAAICIGDFWDQDKNLSDLIIYIGQLISGEAYSTENAFNEEAADWYNENSDSLPFSTLNASATSAPESSEQEFDIEELGDQSDDLELDVIDETDLDNDFSYLSLDESEIATPPPPISPSEPAESETPQIDDVDLDLILLLKRKKRFYALKELIDNIPATTNFEQRIQTEALADKEIETAKSLYQEAEELEHNGSPTEALAKYNEVENKVSDYPAIKDDITRAKQASELLGGISDKPEDQAPEKDSAPQEVEDPKDLTFYEDEHSKKKMGAMPYAFGIAGAILVATLGFFYFSTSNQLSKAENLYSKCEKAIEKDNFFNADKSCTEALGEAKKIQFKANDKQELISSIEKILQSKKLREGLTGNILYEGKYIPITSKETIERFKKHLNDGNTSFEKEEWNKAVDSYSQALLIAEKSKEIDKTLLPPISKNRSTAIFHNAYLLGSSFTEKQMWKDAREHLDTATQALPSLDAATQEKYKKEINKLFEAATYHSLAGEADDFFASGEWSDALKIYTVITTSAPNYLNANPESKKMIEEKMAKADLYITIQSGKDAFASSNWDEAIDKYDAAIKALNENQEILKQVNSADNRKKLSRIKLQASIIRDKQDAARKLKDLNYDSASKKLQKIIDSIESSPFKDEEEFIAIVAEMNETIESANNKQYVADKRLYLEENYKSIFLENYPTATEESLHDPSISFIKKIDDAFLFKLQCIEKGRGRALRLVINYLYDPKTDSWSFYTP